MEGAFVPPETLDHIFSFLTPRERALASGVCKYWMEVADDGLVWRRLCLVKWGVQQPPLVPSHSGRTGWKHLYFSENAYVAIGDIQLSAVAASSTDYPEQSIHNTLYNMRQDYSAFQMHPEMYWSSRGSEDENSSEWLSYRFPSVHIVKTMLISVYKADWQRGSPLYAPKTVRFTFSLWGCAPHYVTCVYPVEKSSDVQGFTIAAPVVATSVTVELIGRTQRQPGDELFYTVIDYVASYGVPFEDIRDYEIAAAVAARALLAMPPSVVGRTKRLDEGSDQILSLPTRQNFERDSDDDDEIEREPDGARMNLNEMQAFLEVATARALVSNSP
eukprot:Opistho-2@39758